MTLTEEQRGTVAFDVEKNRAAIDNAINSLLCEGWDNEASTVRRLVAEIERLRGHEIAARDLSADLTKVAGERDELAARVQELESSLGEAETLTKKNAELMNAYLARIAELEDALAEERAGAIRCEFNDHCEIDLPDAMIRAQQELQAEGKIGPDAAKPQSWQITEERKDVLRFLLSGEFSRDCGCEYCRRALETVRAMLTEAEQCE